MIGTYRWRPSEQQYVKDNWLTMSDVDMGKALSRTTGAVSTQRSHFGLYRGKLPKDGTLASEIRNLWGTVPPGEIAEKLGQSESRIRDVAASRGMGPCGFRKPSPQNPAVRPSGPRGYTATEIAWATYASHITIEPSMIFRCGEEWAQADLILRMDAEGVLRVAM